MEKEINQAADYSLKAVPIDSSISDIIFDGEILFTSRPIYAIDIHRQPWGFEGAMLIDGSGIRTWQAHPKCTSIKFYVTLGKLKFGPNRYKSVQMLQSGRVLMEFIGLGIKWAK